VAVQRKARAIAHRVVLARARLNIRAILRRFTSFGVNGPSAQ
jgi:hypothetical protein